MRLNFNKTKVKSVKLEKTFDFEIRFCKIGLSVMFWFGVNSIVRDKSTYQILASYYD